MSYYAAMMSAKRDDKDNNKKCYRKRQGSDQPFEDDSMQPCTSIIDDNMCCGKNDQCMPLNLSSGDNKQVRLCYSPNNNTADHQQSYYVAGCTDSSYKDDSCFNHCYKDSPYQAVKWQGDPTNQWRCCGSTGGNNVNCNDNNVKDMFAGPNQDFYDDYRANLDKVTHGVKLAIGAIIGIVIACVVVAALGCFCLWKCCFSRGARDKRNRGKFVPLGRTRGADPVWDANVHDHNHNHELHDGPSGNYGYGGQGAPYNPPHQQGPQYTVANFR